MVNHPSGSHQQSSRAAGWRYYYYYCYYYYIRLPYTPSAVDASSLRASRTQPIARSRVVMPRRCGLTLPILEQHGARDTGLQLQVADERSIGGADAVETMSKRQRPRHRYVDVRRPRRRLTPNLQLQQRSTRNAAAHRRTSCVAQKLHNDVSK